MSDKKLDNLVAIRTHMLRYFIEKSTNGELFISKPDFFTTELGKTPILTFVDFSLWTKEHSDNGRCIGTLYYGNVNYENAMFFGQKVKDYSMPHFEKEDVFLSYTIEQLQTRQANLPKSLTKTAEMLGKVIENIQDYLFAQPENAHIKKERYQKVKPPKKEEPENGEER